MAENDKIQQTHQLGFKKVGLAAKLHEAQKAGIDINAVVDVSKLEHRIGIVFDDSGSMSMSAIQNAQKGVEAFCQVCSPINTAIALYPLNLEPRSLTNNMGLIIVTANTYKSSGGTPANRVLQAMIEKEPITRAVVFTDGGFTDNHVYYEKDELLPEKFQGRSNLYKTATLYKDKNVPIDTIYIGIGDHSDMQLLSEYTGGLYVKFEDMEQLKKGLKYLAPTFRAMLTSGQQIKDKIKGE